MNRISLAAALKAEIKTIYLAEAREKKDDASKTEGSILENREEVEFDRLYSQWIFTKRLDESLFLLKPDQLNEPKAFLQKLQTPGDNPYAKALCEKLGVGTQSIEQAITSLNNLLKSEVPIFPPDLEREIKLDEVHKAIFKQFEGKLPHWARNRLYLQTAFAHHIVNVWDTLPIVYNWIHGHPQSALCLSGGGIRSATFGLGVLQGLAGHNILNRFHYLSTVSGGGYIGSWFSAWSFHQGLDAVLLDLKHGYDQEPLKAKPEPLKTEPDQLKHLRQYSNYLTPKYGLTSADTWTLIGTYLRNLLLNWSIFIPALAAVLIVPRLCIAVLRQEIPDLAAYIVLCCGVVSGVGAITYAAHHRPSFQKEKNAKGGQASFLLGCLVPLYLSANCFSALWAWLQNNELHGAVFNGLSGSTPPPVYPFLILGIGLHVLAWLCYFWKVEKGWMLAELGCCGLTGALAGFLLWKGAEFAYTSLNWAPEMEWYVCFAAPYFLGSFLVAVTLFVGLASRLTDDLDREWWARMGAWILIAIAGWSLFSTIVLFGPDWLLKIPRWIASIGGISGLITLLLTHGGKTAANKKEAKDLGTKSIPANIVLALAAPIFIVCLIAALSLGTTWAIKQVDRSQPFHGPTFLSPEDVQDMDLFAFRLKDPYSDPVSQSLWNQLSSPLKQQLTDFTGTERQIEALKISLVQELNDILESDSFFDTNIFALGSLSKDTKATLIANREGQQTIQRNRLLLMDTYPRELAQIRFSHRMTTHASSLKAVCLVFIGLIVASWIFSRFININKFSLHGIYRDRLIRAYLGASNPDRKPNPFSGFDPDDNLHMARLKHRPFHVVNMALNLMNGENLAWQQRKAESFTATPLHAGSYRLGYRRVEEYGSYKPKFEFRKQPADIQITNKDDGLTLGTAVTISGAAASPNMGYHSSPVLAALMTLFNVRLGAWLGNPGPAGERTYKHPAPKSAFKHLVYEALGFANDKAGYVYLSDGGHFENLGLYEMVLRRCHCIVVSDAGCDPNCALEDLGNAIRKIRIDLGIPITIEKFSIASRKQSESKYCAIGDIDYEEVDGPGTPPGKLIYIKPAIGGNEPKDVYNYKELSLLFPHESTSDQWFSESQFESYRMLGVHIITTMCKGANGQWVLSPHVDPLVKFRKQATDYLSLASQTTSPPPKTCVS